jgi:CDP-diacylglycerol--glycerol-3-phosphate 3-phosphatidyltransferase
LRSKQPNLSDEGSNAVQSRRSGLSAASSLKLEASWIAAAALALTTLFAFLLLDPLGPAIARRWLTLACLGLLLLFTSVWTNLNRNRPDDLAPLMPRLGAGTMLSILRGALIVWMAGFLAVPRLAGAAAWIPGLIFAAAISADYLDGYLARRQGMVTKLGEWLDINLDGAAVLAGILIALHAQVLPVWYLLVGLARYIFLLGIWLRVRLNRPVYELRESARRRSLADGTRWEGVCCDTIAFVEWKDFSVVLVPFAFSARRSHRPTHRRCTLTSVDGCPNENHPLPRSDPARRPVPGRLDARSAAWC